MRLKRALLKAASGTALNGRVRVGYIPYVIRTILIHIKDFYGPENFSAAVIVGNYSGEHFGKQSKL
jgi:hypothetical protein